MGRNVYDVRYTMTDYGTERTAYVIAGSKVEAYNIATYEAIPEAEGEPAYSVWVHAVTYQNGKYHVFNTYSGKPY